MVVLYFNQRLEYVYDPGFRRFLQKLRVMLDRIEDYRSVLINGAYSLITRFDETTGCIRSWDHGSYTFPVIIDNMMNLEFLMWAFRETGDSVFYNVCITHTETTILNHFRDDFSSYHVVDYNKTTGDTIGKSTHQG